MPSSIAHTDVSVAEAMSPGSPHDRQNDHTNTRGFPLTTPLKVTFVSLRLMAVTLCRDCLPRLNSIPCTVYRDF